MCEVRIVPADDAYPSCEAEVFVGSVHTGPDNPRPGPSPPEPRWVTRRCVRGFGRGSGQVLVEQGPLFVGELGNNDFDQLVHEAGVGAEKIGHGCCE